MRELRRKLRQGTRTAVTGGRLPLVAALLALAGCGALDPVSASRDNPTQAQVESELTCQCGCGLTVHSCNHLNCSSGEPIKVEIGEQIRAGRTLPEILSHFENKYGEVILSAPTQRGFNLAAWVVPFVMLGIGGVGVVVVLRGWRRSSGEPGGDSGPGGGEGESVTTDPGLRARLEEELEKFDHRS